MSNEKEILIKVRDESGAESVHRCSSPEVAYQLHLLHFGLLGLTMGVSWCFTDNSDGECKDLLCLEYKKKLEAKK